MKKIIFFTLLIISITGCNNSKVEYYPNGKIYKEYSMNEDELQGLYKEYYENGDKKEKHTYDKGVKIDSSIYYKKNKISKVDYYISRDTIVQKLYYPNGKIKETGRYCKNIKVGKWKYFANDRSFKVFEYYNINGQQYTNQGWFFDKRGDTIKNYGNYFSYKILNGSVVKNRTITLWFSYKPIIASNPNIAVLGSTHINESFSNLENSKLDTFYNGQDLEFDTYHDFRTTGKKHLRGYIKEYLTPVATDTADEVSRRIYFDIPIVVKNK